MANEPASPTYDDRELREQFERFMADLKAKRDAGHVVTQAYFRADLRKRETMARHVLDRRW